MSDNKDETAGAGEDGPGSAPGGPDIGVNPPCDDITCDHMFETASLAADNIELQASIDALTTKLAAAEKTCDDLQADLEQHVVDLAAAEREVAELRKGDTYCVDDDGTPFAAARTWRKGYQDVTRALETEVRKHAETRAEVERLRAALEKIRIGTCECSDDVSEHRHRMQPTICERTIAAEALAAPPPETPRESGRALDIALGSAGVVGKILAADVSAPAYTEKAQEACTCETFTQDDPNCPRHAGGKYREYLRRVAFGREKAQMTTPRTREQILREALELIRKGNCEEPRTLIAARALAAADAAPLLDEGDDTVRLIFEAYLNGHDERYGALNVIRAVNTRGTKR